MSVFALFLVVIAAVLHASWNYLVKKKNDGIVFVFNMSLLSSVIWAPVTMGILLFYPEESFLLWGTREWIVVFLSAIVHLAYSLALLYGYSIAPFSIVYPLARGTGPLISSVSAVVLFNELVTTYSVIGILLIITGIFVISWAPEAATLDRKTIQSGVLWGICTGIFISLYTLIDAYGVKTLEMNPVLYDFWAQFLRAGILLPYVMKNSKKVIHSMKLNFRSILIVSIFSPLAYILVLTAMKIAPVSHVAPARELSMLIGAFLGGKLLNEGFLGRRMIGAGMIGFGVITLMV